jgi:hypothetical protein
LFSFDPALYEEIITTTTFEEKKNQKLITLKQVRNKTVQVDIVTESFTIHVGQTGIISNDKNENNDMVVVPFRSMSFGTLALKREKLVKRKKRVSLSSSQALDSSAENFWKKYHTSFDMKIPAISLKACTENIINKIISIFLSADSKFVYDKSVALFFVFSRKNFGKTYARYKRKSTTILRKLRFFFYFVNFCL